MSEPIPKVMLVSGTDEDARRARALLGDRFDVLPGVNGPGLLLDALADGVALFRADGQPVWCNARFRAIDEPTRARIAAICRDTARLGVAAGEPTDADPARKVELATHDEAHHFEVTALPLDRGGPDGPAVGDRRLAVIVRDVTAARRTQQKMSAIERAGAELVRLEADAVRKMNALERLELLQAKITRQARDLLHFDCYTIRLVDEKSGKLELVMSAGFPREATDLELFRGAEGQGISGHVAATGRSYICPDADRDPMFMPGVEGARSSLTVPLRTQDKVIGIFNVESRQPSAFDDEDRVFAEIFARYVSIALHMLDLLVVERSTTNESVSGRVEGELSEPLADIVSEVDWLTSAASRDPETARHVERIRKDVDAIRRRVREVAAGPRTLLGVDKALASADFDPLLAGRRVLVADDEPAVRQVIGEVLGKRGCEVVVCEDGVGAIAAIEAAGRGDQPRFDLIISDIKMPDRNGYEVFATARQSLPGAAVILMTGFGYDPHHSIVRASQEGLQCVLFKPFQVERLMDEVRKAVSSLASAGG